MLERAYTAEVRPLLKRYCHKCHSGELIEAEIDLAAFVHWSDVRKRPQIWQKVAEMLDSGQMPLKEEEHQPTDDERKRLREWVRGFLTLAAQARAGDPGPVVLRRLNNAEYTYTIRDLTGVESLDPARQFPADGAAGEGFTNTGGALVMSPALVTKYLDAAKEIAAHAVLLPDGLRFSPYTTRRDWTNERLDRIRDFYRQFTDARGGDRVNLQGIEFDTNQGGRLAVEKYLAATLVEREALRTGGTSIEAVARRRGLNARYLGTLWSRLTSSQPSLLLDGIRARWSTAKPEDAAALADEIAAWQKGLFRFATVGHIGKVGGPKRWLEPVGPLVAKQELRFKIPTAVDQKDVMLSVVVSDGGDGNDHDFVVLRQPRLVAPGRPDIPLRDVRRIAADLIERRQRMLADTAKLLHTAAEAASKNGKFDLAALARKHGVEATDLSAWLDYLGIGAGGEVKLAGHFTEKLTSASGYDFIQGWGSHDTPLLLANSSDQHVRVPGNMKPRGLAVHPSPKLRAAVGWRSPITATIRIEASVTHAHPECGNGVTWSLELRREATRRRLAEGTTQGGNPAKIGPIESLAVQAGDVVSLLIGPRGGNHSCDLTAVDLQLTENTDGGRSWYLAEEVSSNVLAGNPHDDRFGNRGVWHFYTEPDKAIDSETVIPAGSILAKWLAATDADEKARLAKELQALVTAQPPVKNDGPNGALYRQVTSLSGPLLGGSPNRAAAVAHQSTPTAPESRAIGLDPGIFGKRTDGKSIDAASLFVGAPSVITVTLPADLAAGYELVTTAALDTELGAEGSVQTQVVAGKPAAVAGLQASQATVTAASGPWTSDNRRTSYATPILANEGSGARRRIEAAFDDFRRLFPPALCYTKIVPVDEVVTLTLFYREDDHLMRLMLDEAQQKQLDRLWDELHYVSQDALSLVDAFAQLMEYATQDADPKVFEPLRVPIHNRAAAFRQRLTRTEPKHLDALIELATRAYRRPLTESDEQDLRALYDRLRRQEMSHEEAFRLTLARVLVAPSFLYRIEHPVAGPKQGLISDWELASRLSYFLWSSQPDDELRRMAAAGKLKGTETLEAQTRRMLQDDKVRRLATEFACQWLHIYEFDELDEKSERHFPSFRSLREAMYEESIRFFTDLFQNDGSVLGILDADHTFLNEALAKHYDIAGVTGDEWRRVKGVKAHSRGGILAQATTLAKQSGASRTSPVLRGNWVSEVLLGERLPRPPKGVPQLPDDETATEGLTVRQLVEKHASDAKCAVCHVRIDPLGFALEGFDAIGRRREKDLGDRPIDARAKTMDGAEFDGLDGLRKYLLTEKHDAFVRQFCRKLLGYALGRSVQLSDEPLLEEMHVELKKNNYKMETAILSVVRSRQFREIRGRDFAYDD